MLLNLGGSDAGGQTGAGCCRDAIAATVVMQARKKANTCHQSQHSVTSQHKPHHPTGSRKSQREHLCARPNRVSLIAAERLPGCWPVVTLSEGGQPVRKKDKAPRVWGAAHTTPTLCLELCSTRLCQPRTAPHHSWRGCTELCTGAAVAAAARQHHPQPTMLLLMEQMHL